MGRTIGAFLALVAVIGFVVSIASSAWWNGHPVVNGRPITAKHVSIGPLGATGCNSGGDGSCQPLEITETLEIAFKGALGAIAVATLLAFFVLIAAYKVADSRKGIAKTSLVMTMLAAAGGGALLALGPGLKATNVEVPIGWGAYVFGGSIAASLLAALITRKLEPEPLRLKPSATPQPMPVPEFSPHQVLDSVPPPYGPRVDPKMIPASEDAPHTIPSSVAPPPEPRTVPDHDRVKPPSVPPRIAPPSPPRPRPRPPSGPRSKPSEPRTKPPNAPPRSNNARPPAFRPGHDGTTHGASEEAVTRQASPLEEALTRPAPPLHEQKTSPAPPRALDDRFDDDEMLTQRAPSRVDRARAPVEDAMTRPAPPLVLAELLSHAARRHETPAQLAKPDEALMRPAKPDEELTRPAKPGEAPTRPAKPGEEASRRARPDEPLTRAARSGDTGQRIDPRLAARNDESRPRTKTLPPPAPGSEPSVSRTPPPTRLSPSPTSPPDRASRPKVPMPAPRPSHPTLPNAIPPPPENRVTTDAEPITAVEIDAEAKAAAKQRSGTDARTGQREAFAAEVTETGVEIPRAPSADAPTEIGPFSDVPPLTDQIAAGSDVTDQDSPIDPRLERPNQFSPPQHIAHTPPDFYMRFPHRPARPSPIPTDLPSRPLRSAVSTAPTSLPPPSVVDEDVATGPTPACPQCESPMSWVEEHLRFYCKECRMYF